MTAEEYEKAKQLFLKDNYSLTKIGNILNINRKELSKKLKKDGLYHGKGYTDKQIQEAVKSLNEGESFESICKKLKVDKTSFSKKLISLGYKEKKHPNLNPNSKFNYDSEEAIDICHDYINGLRIRGLEKKYNLNEKIIYNVLDYYGVERTVPRKYKIDESVFEVIDTEEKAYWLGFLYADGYNSMENIELTLKKEDSYMLENFKTFLRSESPICDRNVKLNDKTFISSRINVSSKKICSDLNKHGCFKNKSLCLKPPTTVPKELVRHFVRGYFDGDGSVGCYNGYTQISFVGTEELLYWIQNELNIYPKKLMKCGNAFEFTFKAIKDIANTYHYLYDDSTIFLLRKKNKFVLPSVENVDSSNNRLLESNIGEVVQFSLFDNTEIT